MDMNTYGAEIMSRGVNQVSMNNGVLQLANFEIELNVILTEVRAEIIRAINKHGFSNTPANPELDPKDAFIALAEETGEVAETLTYDKWSVDNRRKELIQVAAMGVASVFGLDAKRTGYHVTGIELCGEQ